MFTRKSIALSASAVCGLVLCGSARGQDSSGMVRITQVQPSTAAAPTPAPVPAPASVGRATVGHGEASDCNADCNAGHSAHCGIWHTCLFGPAGGYGCRFLDYHAYTMAYPVNPWYYDPRDTRVYAAVGFGAPITIPLAPTVQTQVNYSWGIPSSRITPISRVAPQAGAVAGAIAPQPYMTSGPAAPLPPVMPTAPVPR